MTFLLGVFVGVLVGTFVGFVVCALMVAAKGFPQGPDDPGDAGTGLVPPAVAARPGEITEEGNS